MYKVAYVRYQLTDPDAGVPELLLGDAVTEGRDPRDLALLPGPAGLRAGSNTRLLKINIRTYIAIIT